jgi:hypothetical protein
LQYVLESGNSLALAASNGPYDQKGFLPRRDLVEQRGIRYV